MQPTSTIDIRRAQARGQANHGWLQSQHTFSFANYYDPKQMGFGHLRVINEDRVQPARGFGPHGHKNMEIISYVVEGALGHRDTLGTGSVIRPGEVQLMSAGRGIQHSEMNDSREAGVHFLQIWVLPKQANTAPRYDQRDFGTTPGLVLVVSPTGRGGSLRVGQDMDLHRGLLSEGDSAHLAIQRARAWVQVVGGTIDVNGAILQPGDGAALTGASALTVQAHTDAEFLIFDLL